jgi:hypothetical protein
MPQPEKTEILHDAISRGDVDKVRSLIDQGLGVDEPDRFGQRPMFIAARDGQAAVAKLLLERGADVDAAALVREGRRPLYYSAEYGHLDVVRLLIARGAVIDAVDNYGQTALWTCALKLANEALNVPDLARWRSARSSSPTGHVTIAEELIFAGANVNVAPPGASSAAKFIRDAGISRLTALLEGRETPPRSFLSRLFGG